MSDAAGRALRHAAAAAFTAGLTRAAWRTLLAAPPGGEARWARVNHRGEPVTLLEGPAVATGLAAGALLVPGLTPRVRAGAAVAAAAAGAFGVFDDLGETGSSKGLRGHLGALRRGELTTGGAKLLGIGATGVLTAALARPAGPSRGRLARGAALVADGALVAGTANLLNLFDLRPGRALKVALLATPGVLANPPGGLVAAVSTGAAAALLGEDLGERAMLGDGGANALGAVLGTALVAGGGPRARAAALAGVVALTLASEQVSFTRVIASTPGLRELDALGRRPAAR